MIDVISAYFASIFRPETLVQDIIAQVLGVLGLIISASSYQRKKQKSILIMQSIANACFTLMFLLLQAYAGMFMNLISMVRDFLYSKRDKYPFFGSVTMLIIFMVLSAGAIVLSMILSVTPLLELLPGIAMIITNIAFRCKLENNMRKLMVFTSPLWIVYNIMSRAFSGAITESIIMTSMIVSIIRYSGVKKEKTNNIINEEK